jgi:hypothetical protein
MTDTAKQPKHEREATALKMQRVVLRPGFNLDAYWKNLRKNLPVYDKEKRG